MINDPAIEVRQRANVYELFTCCFLQEPNIENLKAMENLLFQVEGTSSMGD
ncbi:MAG: hypothetical protein H6Q63_681, partial [Firmicutes bacterium]|nr:hypothetical protein [Bacillota bacterium]